MQALARVTPMSDRHAACGISVGNTGVYQTNIDGNICNCHAAFPYLLFCVVRRLHVYCFDENKKEKSQMNNLHKKFEQIITIAIFLKKRTKIVNE